ncbi:60S ribosomal protein L41 [Hirschfeldia incana]|nr:60S ribosomal protein L41 [Hirschfeldia incana]
MGLENKDTTKLGFSSVYIRSHASFPLLVTVSVNSPVRVLRKKNFPSHESQVEEEAYEEAKEEETKDETAI